MEVQKSGGFLLIEFLVYLFIFSVLIILVMQFVVSSSYQLTVGGAHIKQIVQLYSAQMRMTRDVQCAPAARDAWLKSGKNCLIWHDQDQDIGWCLEGENLYRKQGEFNQDRETWHAKNSCLAAVGITKATFLITWMPCDDAREQVKKITIKLESKQTVQWVVVPRNRKLQ